MSENQNETVCASVRPGRRTSVVAFSDAVVEDDPLLRFDAYLHAAPRRNSITPDKQRAFIAMLAATGIVTQAARSIGVSLESLYKLRNRAGAEGFSAAWDAALERGFSRLEDCALERAIAGEERPVVWDGKVVATWKRYDTGLLTFLLKTRRSGRYGGDRDGAVAVKDLKPGNPVYDRLRRAWAGESYEDVKEVRASIHRKLLELREQVLAQKAAEAEAAAEAAEVAADDPETRPC
jgi:hypothetical protein